MNKFAFIDIETTGLHTRYHTILEIALVVTNSDLQEIESYTTAIKALPEELSRMDEWCTKQHTSSGLLADVEASTKTVREVEDELEDIVARHFGGTRPPMSGSSVHFDKAFIEHHMPFLHRRFSHRIIDVSSFMGALSIHKGITIPALPSDHRALPDVRNSIAYLKQYLARFV